MIAINMGNLNLIDIVITLRIFYRQSLQWSLMSSKINKLKFIQSVSGFSVVHRNKYC